jgi:dynein intermediate chain 1
MPDEVSEGVENEDDLIMDQANMGGIDQEQLTAEEKDEQIIKTLNSFNPQAPHNLCQYSFNDRKFVGNDQVEHLVFHVNMDGCILLKDSDDARDQEDEWDNKNKMNAALLDKMDAATKAEFGDDPLDNNQSDKDNTAQKKSLRNQFNF